MIEIETVYWLLFTLIFGLLPIKSIVKFLFEGFLGRKPTAIPCIEEEGLHQWHRTQLYRPGDKKYARITHLLNKAKPIN